MNTGKGGANFKQIRILFYSVCSSTVVIGMLITKLTPKEDSGIQWHTQAGSIATNLKVKIYFILPELSAAKSVMWACHIYESTKGSHDMILGRDLLKYLGLNIKLSDHVTKSDYVTLKGSSTLMINLGTYEFIHLNIRQLHLNNSLQMLIQKKYMIQKKSILLLNYWV